MLIGGNMLLYTTIAKSIQLDSMFGKRWIASNLASVFVLLSALFFGASYEYTGVRNTAFVYSLVYAFSKYVEIFIGLFARYLFHDKTIFILAFTTLTFLYYMTCVIERNPDFIYSLFSHQIT